MIVNAAFQTIRTRKPEETNFELAQIRFLSQSIDIIKSYFYVLRICIRKNVGTYLNSVSQPFKNYLYNTTIELNILTINCMFYLCAKRSMLFLVRISPYFCNFQCHPMKIIFLELFYSHFLNALNLLTCVFQGLNHPG